jgi:hypothetical protein
MELTIEDAARARQEAADALEKAHDDVQALRPLWETTTRIHAERKRELDRIDAAMAGVAAAGRVRAALEAQGIEYDGPAIISWEVVNRVEFAPLAAVGPKGTGLYIDVPKRSHRYQGKTHLVLTEHLRRAGVTGAVLVRGEGMSRRAVWEERGTGSFGPGSGSMKPKAPPEGGRWRWLKVAPERELTA